MSLSHSYEHVTPILNEPMDFAEVIDKLLSEERRLKSEGLALTKDSVSITSNGKKKKKNFMQNKGCWERGQSRHLKRDRPDRASSTKGSGSDAKNDFLLMGDIDVV